MHLKCDTFYFPPRDFPGMQRSQSRLAYIGRVGHQEDPMPFVMIALMIVVVALSLSKAGCAKTASEKGVRVDDRVKAYVSDDGYAPPFSASLQ